MSEDLDARLGTVGGACSALVVCFLLWLLLDRGKEVGLFSVLLIGGAAAAFASNLVPRLSPGVRGLLLIVQSGVVLMSLVGVYVAWAGDWLRPAPLLQNLLSLMPIVSIAAVIGSVSRLSREEKVPAARRWPWRD